MLDHNLQVAKTASAANLPTTTTPSAARLSAAAADATIEIPDVQSGADRTTPAAAAAAPPAAAGRKDAGSTPAGAAAAPAGECRCQNNSSDMESCQASAAGGSSSREGDGRCCGCTGRLCDNASSAEVRWLCDDTDVGVILSVVLTPISVCCGGWGVLNWRQLAAALCGDMQGSRADRILALVLLLLLHICCFRLIRNAA